jgi:hypothetical protein
MDKYKDDYDVLKIMVYTYFFVSITFDALKVICWILGNK